MSRCFVIQPFDHGKFDKRFVDVFKPAIESAGLEAYRVDQDPFADVPIEAIEAEIIDATVCLADITTDNPNVWYELGFASACHTPVVMVCSSERPDKSYPFDIQHRSITRYNNDSLQDFKALGKAITDRLNAAIKKREQFQAISDGDRLTMIEGLSQLELMVLAATAETCLTPMDFAYANLVKSAVEEAGFTSMAFSIGLHGLTEKRLIAVDTERDWHNDQASVLTVTSEGWSWISRNTDRFVLERSPIPETTDEKSPDAEIPF